MRSSSPGSKRDRARPDDRPGEDRLRTLREQIATGTYDVSAERIAGAILASGGLFRTSRGVDPG